MYNTELKTRFAKEFTESESLRKACLHLFNYFEKYENEWQADLCTKDAETLRPIINSIIGMRVISSRTRLNILRNYGKWCMHNKVPGSCNGVLDVIPDNIDKVRSQMIRNPKHLQKCLDEIFAPESANTVDNTYRCFYWLAYAGMKEEDILKVKGCDVRFDIMSVVYNGNAYPLYRESLEAFQKCVSMNQFVYMHPNYSRDKVVYRDRAEGDELVRGIRAMPKVNAMRTELSKKSRKAREENQTEMCLSYFRVWLSGIFYRLYESELAGDEPDFKGLVDFLANGKEYKVSSGRNTQESKRRRLASEYAADYRRWKMTL